MKKTLLLISFLLSLITWCHAWQQRVAYDIDVTLDTVKHYLHGKELLRYWNNSPDTLKYVWFHLYPNAYRDLNSLLARDAERFHDYRGRSLKPADRGFINIASLAAAGQELALSYGDDATSARVDLPAPLAPGDSMSCDISFSVKLPKIISRLGHSGTHYEVSQWYPKIVVYDDKGWHPDGYHYLGEFYGDYGSFNVGITTPKGMKIGATGVEIADTTDSLSQENDSTEYRLFCADNVHDFAWCADAKYIETSELHDGVQIRVLTLPQDTVKWKNVMQYSKDALDYYGKWYGKYPYPVLTVCDGKMSAGGGMEYPNLVIISKGGDKYTRTLEMVVMHEIGHQWFYGMLGNNEMDEAWLDEGINSFSEERYFEEKYGPQGNFLAKPRARRWFPELSDRYIGRILYAMFSLNRMEQPVLSRTCMLREPALYGAIAYKKPALMMWWLKSYLGDDTFDRVMQNYFRKYQYRHVTTGSFFGVVDSVAKKDLRPYFMPMLTTTDRCDYAISSVSENQYTKNLYRIDLCRKEGLKLPVTLQLLDRSNNNYLANWTGQGKDTTIFIQAGARLQKATLDPGNNLLEINRYDNHWPRQCSFTLFPRLPSFDKYQIWAVPLPWYDGVNGFRFGPILHGGYLIDGGPMLGRHNWTASSYYGFKSRQLSWSLDYQTPVSSLSMPPRIYGSLGKAYDTYWASAGIRRSWGQALMAPEQRFDVRLDFNKVVTVDRFWDGRDIEPGECWLATAERSYIYSSWRLGSDLRAASSVGLSNTPGAGTSNFLRAEIEEKAYVRFNKYVRLNLRGIAGHIAGDPPIQEEYFLSGAFKATGINNMIISYRDWFSAQERYHIDGGANLPGYAGRHARGKSVLALNLSVPLYRTPVRLFAGAGQIVNDWSDFKLGQTATNAGIDLRLPGVRLLLPLWINQPLPGKPRFDWRWKFSIGDSFSISL